MDLEHLRQVVAKTPDAPVESPARIGKYTIDREVARGGMGAVFRATDPDLRRVVALKVLLGSEPEDAVRLYREARAAARLQHPNIVGIHDVGDDAGRHFIAMDFIDGPTLRAARLPTRRAVEVLASVAAAVHYAHEQGIVHRDLKPDNILIASDGRAVVSDFGLARVEGSSRRLTRSGDMCGTPVYMSPEQVRGKGVGPKSDVYALGVILYEILTGTLPFGGTTLEEICVRIVTEEAPRPSSLKAGVDRDLENVALKAMAHEPDARYATAGELAADLRRWLAGEPVRGRAPSTLRRVVRNARRHPAAASLAGALVLALAIGAYFMWAVRAMDRRRSDTVRRMELIAESAIDGYQKNLQGLPGPLDRERAELERVSAELQIVAAENPDAPELLILIGRIDAELGRHDKAVERMTRALERLGPRARGVHYLHRALVRVALLRSDSYRRRALQGWLERERQAGSAARADIDEARRRGLELPAEQAGYVDAVAHFVHDEIDACKEACDRLLLLQDLPRTLRADVYSLRGSACIARLDAVEALKSFAEAARIKRSDPQILIGLAVAHLLFSHPSVLAPGMKAAEDAARVDPSSEYPWILLAALHGQTADGLADQGSDPAPALREAEAALDHAAGLASGNVQVQSVRAGLRLTRARWLSNTHRDPLPELDATVADCEKALAADPADRAARRRRASALQIMAGHRRAEALELLDRALVDLDRLLSESDADHKSRVARGLVHAKRALVLCRTGADPTEAFERAIKDLGSTPDMIAVQELGYAHLERGIWNFNRGQPVGDDPARAIEAFERVLGFDRRRIDALMGLGRARFLACAEARDPKLLPPAIEAFRQAVALAPQHADARVALGDALRAGGEFREAVSCYEEAVKLVPSLKEVVAAALEDCRRQIKSKP